MTQRKTLLHYRVISWQPFYFIPLRFFAKLPLLLFPRFSVYYVMSQFKTQKFIFCSENSIFPQNTHAGRMVSPTLPACFLPHFTHQILLESDNANFMCPMFIGFRVNSILVQSPQEFCFHFLFLHRTSHKPLGSKALTTRMEFRVIILTRYLIP